MKITIEIWDKRDGTVSVTAEFEPKLTPDTESPAACAAIAALEAIKKLAAPGTTQEGWS